MAGTSTGRLRLLGYRDFRLLVVAFLIDQIGSWAYSIVLAVYVYDRTGSSAWLAGVAASRWIPLLVVGGLAGVLADRYERTNILVVSALASAMVITVVGGVVAADGPLALLLVLQGVSAVVSSPYRPAAGGAHPRGGARARPGLGQRAVRRAGEPRRRPGAGDRRAAAARR